MRHLFILPAFLFLTLSLFAGTVEKSYHFNNLSVKDNGKYRTISFENTRMMGKTGEPSLPFRGVSVLLPPGEAAQSVQFIGEEETEVPGNFLLFPKQEVRPISKGFSGIFSKNEAVYQTNAVYPASPMNTVQTQYLNGYAFALTAFTPVRYNPATGKLSYYKKVTLRITTAADNKSAQALKNLTSSKAANERVRSFAENPEMMQQYALPKASSTAYQMLIITPMVYQSGFTDLIQMYQAKNIACEVETVEDIMASTSGIDSMDRIRNYIIQEYQTNSIEYVLLGGDIELVPFRGLYDTVISGSGYVDYNIPADLYYSGLDGNWNTNGNNKWGEPGEDDLLPDVAVARFPFSNSTELANLVHKSVAYQTTPVVNELKRVLLAGEFLYSDPLTFGGNYLNLLVGNHNDNGYQTFGITAANHDITKLYDTLVQAIPDTAVYEWPSDSVIAQINRGTAFIHHLGHSNYMYMMRMYIWQISNSTFPLVNGIDHNYPVMYTQGCIDGAFDYDDCIAEASVNISNFLAAGVFNSRYGWFDQGTTDGPSEHLEREFVSALYNDTLPITSIGAAHQMSKIKTAPYVGLPNEFEPGAQRWVHYDCNVLGDPAMAIWTTQPNPQSVPVTRENISFAVYPNPAFEILTVSIAPNSGKIKSVALFNTLGQSVREISNPATDNCGKTTLTFTVSSLEAGIYYLKISSETSTGLSKVIIGK